MFQWLCLMVLGRLSLYLYLLVPPTSGLVFLFQPSCSGQSEDTAILTCLVFRNSCWINSSKLIFIMIIIIVGEYKTHTFTDRKHLG